MGKNPSYVYMCSSDIAFLKDIKDDKCSWYSCILKTIKIVFKKIK